MDRTTLLDVVATVAVLAVATLLGPALSTWF